MNLVEGKSNVTELQIGSTLFIVEYGTSETATETAYDKIKRLIISHANDREKLSETTKLSA
nr:MAG TPA: transposon-encoded protein [Caudoviricetes sp.]